MSAFVIDQHDASRDRGCILHAGWFIGQAFFSEEVAGFEHRHDALSSHLAVLRPPAAARKLRACQQTACCSRSPRSCRGWCWEPLRLKPPRATRWPRSPSPTRRSPPRWSCPRAAAPAKDLPEYCRVTATLRPSADSDIKVEVWLPTNGWNGKLLAVGNGGWNGNDQRRRPGRRAAARLRRERPPTPATRATAGRGCSGPRSWWTSATAPCTR